MDSSILATTTASFAATLPGLSRCLQLLQAFVHSVVFFFPLGSMITRDNQCGVLALVLQGFVEVSIRAGSFSVAMEIDKLLGREDRRRHMRHAHNVQTIGRTSVLIMHGSFENALVHSIAWESVLFSCVSVSISQKMTCTLAGRDVCTACT